MRGDLEAYQDVASDTLVQPSRGYRLGRLRGIDMIATNGYEIGGKDFFGRREDLSFIVRFQWKTSNHLKEAIQVLLAARLDESSTMERLHGQLRSRSDVLDDREFQQIRLQIASNPNTPPAVLTYLARQADARLLERIAENPRTPVETLERLAQSAIPSVRIAVAENVNTSLDLLIHLATDFDADVRYTLAENGQLPVEVLSKLVDDSNPYVSTRALATINKVTASEATIVHHDFRDRSARGEQATASR